MFKEDIKIKILDEEHFNKVKEILVKERYKFPTNINSSTKCYYLTAYQSYTTPYVNYGHSPECFNTHANKEYILWGPNKLVPKVGVTLPQPVELNKILTPCEQLGYKVGDKFIVTEYCGTFEEGIAVELFRDDGTNNPLFKGKTKAEYFLCGWRRWCICKTFSSNTIQRIKHKPKGR